MPNVILRHRALPFCNFSKEWRAFNPKQIAQIQEYARQQFISIQLRATPVATRRQQMLATMHDRAARGLQISHY